MQSKRLHLTRAGCTDMLKNHFQRFLSKTPRKSSKWFLGIQRNNNLKSVCFVSMLPRCSVTFEVRTEKFPFSPVKDMLWTKEKSPSCHSSKMMDIKMSINIFFSLLNSRLGFQDSPANDRDTSLTLQVWGSQLCYMVRSQPWSCIRPSFPTHFFVQDSSSNTANATRRSPAKFTRIVYSPLKVSLTTDTRFRYHSSGIVPT